MILYLYILIILSLCGCAHIRPDHWDKVEIGQAVVLTALMAVDYGQSSMIVRNPDRYYEINPILGDHPTQGAVNAYFPIAWAVKLAVAHFLPHPWRKAWLAFWAGESAVMVGRNYSIGLKP